MDKEDAHTNMIYIHYIEINMYEYKANNRKKVRIHTWT